MNTRLSLYVWKQKEPPDAESAKKFQKGIAKDSVLVYNIKAVSH